MQFINQVARNFRMILKVCLAINQGFSGRFAGLGYVQSVSWYCFYWCFKIQNVLTLYIYIYILFFEKESKSSNIYYCPCITSIYWNIIYVSMLLTDFVCVIVLEVWGARADGLCLPPVGRGRGMVHHRVLYPLYPCLWCL